MKHGFHSAFRSILLAAFAFLTAGSANAQISPVPPCDGPMTIYFSVLYRDCASARANVKVVPNCGTTPFSYQWSNGTISSELLDVLPGTYTATVTDAKGLKATGSVTVLPPASTPFNMNAAVVGLGCTGGGGTGSATVTFSGGTGPFDLKWRKVGGSAYQNVQNVSSPYTITGLTAGNWMIIGNDERACRDTAFVEIKQGLVVTTSTSGATCAGANVTVNASGGTSPYKIAWTGGATLNNATLPRTFSNVPSGPYTFTITDATGCSGTATAQVNGVPNFTIGASSTAVTCTNSQAGSITVTLTTPGTAPYSIQLNNGPAQPATFPFTFNNLAAGEYSIRVTDASNCTSNTNAKVETALDVVLQVKAPASPLCGGSDVAVSLANSGTAPYTITWAGVNGFSGTATVSSFPYTLPNVPPGPITVNVKDATGCTGSETGTSVGNPVMQIRAVNLVHPTCANPQGGAFTVEFVNPGTAPHTLQWSGNATPTAFNGTATFSNLGGGTYTVTVTDANNCTATVSAKIDPALMVVLSPKPAANADCGGQDVEVSLSGNPGVSPYTIEWAGGLGLQNGVVKNQTMPFTISNAAPGSFCVTVTDKEGCVGTACVTVTGNPVLLIKASNVTHPTCANPKGGSFTIEIVSPGNPPNYSVAFNGPSSPIVNGFTYSNLGPGLYEVIVTDGKGCTDSMQVKIESPLDVVLSPQPAANAKCGGADVVVSIAGNPGTPPYTITWSGGNGAQTGTATNQTLPFTISNAAPGQFCVTLTDQEQSLGIECTTGVGP
ncbi:MAG TPA: SprB repeat-containing protein, partial [Saprospiraceae bacterium]|nr:SprB repeat-containing protein [Saprospiraceae bacterium]